MSHKPGGPEDRSHEKHLQLGTVLGEDNDRSEIPEDEHDAAWADATTVEEFADGLEALRVAGWPVGD